MPKNNRNLIVNLYKGFTPVSNKLTDSYTDVYGVPCDLYFPVHYPKYKGTYSRVNIYEPEELPEYKEEPDLIDQIFYIPNLMRKQSMNSVANAFDNFALMAEGKETRPFIETRSSRELPIATKVVVKLDKSLLYYFVDQKLVVNGVNGHMLLRMFLSPLTKDKAGRDMRKRD